MMKQLTKKNVNNNFKYRNGKIKFEYQNAKNILQNIYNQINSFDNKASILISVIGILFGLSFSFLNVLDKVISNENDLTLSIKTGEYIIFSITYIYSIVNAILSIFFALLVIIPRKHNRGEKYINYYNDLKNMSYEDFLKKGDEFVFNNKKLFEQININSKICSKKHFYLKASIISLGPYAISIIALVVFSIIFTI